jgi:lipoprotein-releasing system ATP-binding protein
MPPLLELRGVRRVFKQAGSELPVLNGIDLVLQPGEVVGLVGPSGAGKSTMLHVAGLLERPDGGAVLIGGEDCGRLNDEKRTLLRCSAIGFVYQFHHLLPEFSALENVAMPLYIRREDGSVARNRAAAMLERVGLAHRSEHRPGGLSGGSASRSRGRW